MYANTAMMNPIRFLCIQKYARLPVSNIMIRGEKRTSALETSPLSLLLELLCTGLGSWYTAKLPAPAKSCWLLQLSGNRGTAAEGTQRLALPALPGCSRFTGAAGQGQQNNRELWSLITCFVFSGARIHFCYRIIEEPTLEAAMKDLLVQPLVEKGTCHLAPWDCPNLKISSDGHSAIFLGRLFHCKKCLYSIMVRLLLSLGFMTNLFECFQHIS